VLRDTSPPPLQVQSAAAVRGLRHQPDSAQCRALLWWETLPRSEVDKPQGKVDNPCRKEKPRKAGILRG